MCDQCMHVDTACEYTLQGNKVNITVQIILGYAEYH